MYPGCGPKRGCQGTESPGRGSGGVLQVETFLEAASEAGLQGAQPLLGGPDNSTQKSDKKRKEEILGKEQAR